MRGERTGIALVVSIAVLAAIVGCGSPIQSKTELACADAVLSDWSNGALDSAYPDDCYRAALEALPEDLRAYTSAADDITRVLRSRAGVQRPGAEPHGKTAPRHLTEVEAARLVPASSDGLRTLPLPVVLLAGVLLVVVASGVAASVVRRRRLRR
jgi:hypothetical protein